jgi:hypothetical protein
MSTDTKEAETHTVGFRSPASMLFVELRDCLLTPKEAETLTVEFLRTLSISFLNSLPRHLAAFP